MNDELLPREKALQYGISSLNNIELLALIIKFAYKDRNVMQLAEDVIKAADGFSNLLSLTYEELVAIKGIKKAKALEIMAILEIYKRLSKVDRISEPELNSPGKIVEWLRFQLSFSHQEEFFVVYLNARGNIIKSEVMFKGNSRSSLVGIDEILRKAILIKASMILVAHNHPSDNVEPSNADLELTARLSEASSMMGIPLIDHIIVGKSDYFSFKNHGMLG
ncbi:MAG: DNA repair protein RadC [Erysipelotrichaceae bacterium]|nr:DNA repair protein RadC [Erysipelotrichaceae bacterium]